MDENLDFLNEARIVFSQLLIHIGFQQLQIFPQADPEEFLDTFFPPRNDILEMLCEEQSRLKKKKRSREIKTNKNRGRFNESQIKQLRFAACSTTFYFFSF
jgi:hypothetical protein